MSEAFFGLMGSIIGASAVAWVAWYQIRSERQKIEDQRLFEGRRVAFESGVCLFHFIATKRWREKVFVGPNDKETEKYAGYDTMGRLGLHASDELMREIFVLLGLFEKTIPNGEEETERDKKEIKAQRKIVMDLMRRELGIIK